MALLELHEVCKSYQRIPILKQISLEVQAGEIVGLVGESGSGKSTLARIIAGLEEADRGALFLREVPLITPRPKPIKRAIQLTFQNVAASFNPKFTVESSLKQPFIEHQLPLTEERITELLEAVGLERTLLKHYPHQLSGGQIQRFAIARALACQPELVIADEPTSALDPLIKQQILRLFGQLGQSQQLAFLLITHDILALEGLAERLYIIHQGEIVESGPTSSLLAQPQHPYSKRLIAAIPTLDPADRTLERYRELC